MGKNNIAVAMGGYSSEFEISIKSGGVVCESLDKSKYNIYPIHILESGWYYVAKNGTKYPVNKADFSFENGSETPVIPDVVFNTIHGTPGEDGYLQAYWDLLGIPHTSADYYQAALSFNKRDCLSVLKNFGVLCANSYYVNKGTEINVEEIVRITGLPCFVKPNRSGSSFGISKVNEMSGILPAIEKAFSEDTEVIIETALVGVEVSVGVYNDGNEIIALPVTEIVSENEFFDFEAKYLGQSQEITPARISDKETDLVKKEAVRIYKLLKMKGIARSEFIIEKEKPYFIETNTNPGLSTESIVPKQVREAGMTLTQFFDILIQNVIN
ncbi:D-alanine--D-alanine ligase [Aequorivita xiaoshiensis]|uniref:D-alanine--D-alanine ligase n=1 Tax=Aequorivita xiaoshiensis TaxID=2874476 RepID=A0A9X1U430_9FLAO|nr:D-alanine--D-alanine ligase [Aequorivita xiaoshiensis]MCG2431504.1 D-alanine--D-alanine ligase [Aequorivita xiaoshiensis]